MSSIKDGTFFVKGGNDNALPAHFFKHCSIGKCFIALIYFPHKHGLDCIFKDPYV